MIRESSVLAHRGAIQMAAAGNLQAIAQLRACTVCRTGIIPAPPAPRVCPGCGAVNLIPALADLPPKFLAFLGHGVVLQQFRPGASRQQTLERILQSLYCGTAWGTPPLGRIIPFGTPAADVFPFALYDYMAWLDAGAPTDPWKADA